MTKYLRSKYCRAHWIADPAEELDLLGPSNVDGVPPHVRERLTVCLRNSAADADVIVERIYADGVVVRQYCRGGTR